MPFLRPGQGFKKFKLGKKASTISSAGTPGKSASFSEIGEIIGILVNASQKEVDQWKQSGHPISHVVVQRGAMVKGEATQYLRLTEQEPSGKEKDRYFYIQGINNPGELNHTILYYVEERGDLKNG